MEHRIFVAEVVDYSEIGCCPPAARFHPPLHPDPLKRHVVIVELHLLQIWQAVVISLMALYFSTSLTSNSLRGMIVLFAASLHSLHTQRRRKISFSGKYPKIFPSKSERSSKLANKGEEEELSSSVATGHRGLCFFEG